jgi:hypothetical protein
MVFDFNGVLWAQNGLKRRLDKSFAEERLACRSMAR